MLIGCHEGLSNGLPIDLHHSIKDVSHFRLLAGTDEFVFRFCYFNLLRWDVVNTANRWNNCTG